MYKWCFLLLLFAPLFAEEEIIVHLSNEEHLVAVYLMPIEEANSGFDGAYVRQLENVLAFDLKNNGKTALVSQKDASEYVVIPSITNQKLTTTLTSTKSGAKQGVAGLALSGALAKDRRTLHSVADSLHEVLFGKRGVCDTRVLYTVRTRNGSSSDDWVTEVWESDYDGANRRQVTHHNGLCVTPTYVPSAGGRAHHLLYVCYEVGQPKIYATSVDNGESVRLSYLRGNQLMPVISPKKDQIAFISDITGNPDLFIQDFSLEEGLIGKPRQIFSAPQATQGTPTFSPNGERIAFVSNKDGTPRIYALKIPAPGVSLKEIHPMLISKENRNNTSPAWSPDGNKIAYSATTQGVRQVWVYDFTTGKEIQITDGYGHKENPTWAPDSLHLMFNSSTPTTSDLFLINLHQKSAVKITSGPGEKRFPAWEPLTTRKI